MPSTETSSAEIPLRPRRSLAILGLAAVCLAWVAGVLFYRGLRPGEAALPVEVVVRTARPVSPFDARLIHVYRSGYSEVVEPVGNWQVDPTRPWCATGVGSRNRHFDRWVRDARQSAGQHRTLRWHIADRWIRGLIIGLPEDTWAHVSSVLVTSGGRKLALDDPSELVRLEGNVRHQVSEALREPGFVYRKIDASPLVAGSRVPVFAELVNYPGDVSLVGWLLRRLASHPAVWLLLVFFACVWWLRWYLQEKSYSRLAGWLAPGITPNGNTGTQRQAAASAAGWLAWCAGLAVLVGVFAVLECRSPYYFLEDDNFAIFFPPILSGAEALGDGVFFQWSPFQFLGMPVASVGVFALTYPGTYASYALAAGVLGDAHATLEVFCIAHLVLGYAAMFRLVRRWSVHPALAAAAGLSWSLCGYALVAGRSWYYMTPAFTFLPLVALALSYCVQSGRNADGNTDCRLGLRWVLLAGVCFGLYFHAGNAQMWLFAWEIFAVWSLVAAVTGRINRRAVLRIVQAALVAVAVAAPLLVPQLMTVTRAERPGGPQQGILDGLAAVFAPHPLVTAPNPSDWGDPGNATAGGFYYAGTVLAGMWLLGLAAALAVRHGGRLVWGNPWYTAGLVALLLGLGSEAGLWYLQSKLPLFGAVYHPMKYLPLAFLFMISGGAVLLERLRRARPRVQRSAIAWGAGTCVMGLMVYHALATSATFYSYASRHYRPPPAEALQALGSDARIMPVVPFRSPAEDYTQSLGHNVPMLWQIESASGYGGFVSYSPAYRRFRQRLQQRPVDTLSRYGVTHLVVHRTAVVPQRSASRAARWAESESLLDVPELQRFCRATAPVYADRSIMILPIPQPAPRAWYLREPSRQSGNASTAAEDCLKVDRHSNGLVVRCAEPIRPRGVHSATVVVNYLWRPEFRATAAGKTVPCRADALGRIAVDLPAGATQVTLTYKPPWCWGWAFAAVLLVVAAGLHWAIRSADEPRGVSAVRESAITDSPGPTGRPGPGARCGRCFPD